jgi:hypothetical protein
VLRLECEIAFQVLSPLQVRGSNCDLWPAIGRPLWIQLGVFHVKHWSEDDWDEEDTLHEEDSDRKENE